MTVDNNWHNADGNQGAGFTSPVFVVDTLTPTVAVAVDSANVNVVNDTTTVHFTFSQAPTDFLATNITANGGTISGLTKVDGTHYTATFTANPGTDIATGSVTSTTTGTMPTASRHRVYQPRLRGRHPDADGGGRGRQQPTSTSSTTPPRCISRSARRRPISWPPISRADGGVSGLTKVERHALHRHLHRQSRHRHRHCAR